MMHPAMLQELAAEHVKDMIATAEKAKRAQEAQGARRSLPPAGGAARPAAHPVDTRPTVNARADRDRPTRVTPTGAAGAAPAAR
jgi:hypothetical protein